MGVMKKVNTHSKERQQQLHAFTVQPKTNKRRSAYQVQQWMMGMWRHSREEGSELLSMKCSMRLRASDTLVNTQYLGAWLIIGCSLYLGKL